MPSDIVTLCVSQFSIIYHSLGQMCTTLQFSHQSLPNKTRILEHTRAYIDMQPF